MAITSMFPTPLAAKWHEVYPCFALGITETKDGGEFVLVVEEGRLQWVPFDEVRIVDPSVTAVTVPA